MSENLGIETRSRSRSKTPGLLFGENGDSGVKGKKIPTISLIEEEDDILEVASQPTLSQRPKRQRRSAKAVTSDTSGDVSNDSPRNSQKSTEVVSNSKKSVSSSSTTTTTIVSSKQVINGSENGEEKHQQSTRTTNTVTTTTAANSDELPENQSLFNNIFNAIKTSTPILSSKRTKRVTLEAKSTGEINYDEHPAYKEYKEAGEYWNKYPKTDYTYSELSPHRRELGKGVVAMPNMSRRSLEKYTNRVEAMIQHNPTEESFLRRKFLSNLSFQKRSADLQYDSADEVDVSIIHQKLASRRLSHQNFFYRFYLLVVSALSTAYSRAQQGVKRIFYYRTNQRYAYTPIKSHQQGLSRRVYDSLQRFVLLCVSKIYLFISTVLCMDTWVLYTRSENVVENRKRKRFLLGLIFLLPLLLLGGTYIYLDPPQSISFPKITLPKLPKITFPKISFPSITLPSLSFNISWPQFSLPSWPAWLTLPSFSFTWPTISLPSWPVWLTLPSFSFSWPQFSFAWPEISLPSWPAWLALPALSWPAWLHWPEISFGWPAWLTFTLPSLSWPEWLKLPEFSFSWPELSLPSWPEWLKMPEFSLPSWSWPSFSFSRPEWMKLPEFSFSLPKFSLPSFSLPSISFGFLEPITTFTVDSFTSLKSSSIYVFDQIRDATVGLLNEAQIVWNENFNAK